MVIISFIFLFMFCIMLSVDVFFFSCVNRFPAFQISFNMDVFIVISSFLVLCSVFIAFNPKTFVIRFLTEFCLVFLLWVQKCSIFFFCFCSYRTRK